MSTTAAVLTEVQRALDLVSSVYSTPKRTAILAGSEIIIVVVETGEVVGTIRNVDQADHLRIADRLITALTGAV